MKKIVKTIILILIPAHALLLTRKIIPTNSVSSIRESFSPISILLRDNLETSFILAGMLIAGLLLISAVFIRTIRRFLIIRRLERLEKVIKKSKNKVNKLEKDIFKKYHYMNSEIINEFAPIRLLLNTLENKLEILHDVIDHDSSINLDYLLHEEIKIRRDARHSVLNSATYNNLPESIDLDSCEKVIKQAYKAINSKLLKLKVKVPHTVNNFKKEWVHARNV